MAQMVNFQPVSLSVTHATDALSADVRRVAEHRLLCLCLQMYFRRRPAAFESNACHPNGRTAANVSAESLRGAKKDATWLHVYPAHEVFIKKNVLKFHAQAECSKCPVYRAFEIDGSMDNYSR